jgi:hypothetical protein
MPTPQTPGTFSIQCPCCDTELVIDEKTRTVLHHQAAATTPPTIDFAAEVARLRGAGAEREQAFQRSMENERTREERNDRKFDELLRRARETADGKPIKDIDL